MKALDKEEKFLKYHPLPNLPVIKTPLVTDYKFQHLNWEGDSMVDIHNKFNPPLITKKYAVRGSGASASVFFRVKNGECLAVKQYSFNETDLSQWRKHGMAMHFLAQQISPHVVRMRKILLREEAIVMEYMPNGSLDKLIKKDGFLPVNIRLRIALDILQGLYELHKYRILHGDLKPANILLDAYCRAFLCDFDESRFEHIDPKFEYSSRSLYLAPETFQRSSGYSTASDIYSFGIVLWELLTRSKPYKHLALEGNYIAKGIFDAILNHKTNPFPENFDPRLKILIQSCWEIEPGKRPSAAQLIFQLRSFMLATLTLSPDSTVPFKIKKSASFPELTIFKKPASDEKAGTMDMDSFINKFNKIDRYFVTSQKPETSKEVRHPAA
jgi:serine/threonine protein kinase